MELVNSREFLLGLEGEEGRSCFMHPKTSQYSSYDPSKSRTTQMLYFGDHRVYEQHNDSSSSSSLNSPLSSSTKTTNSNSKSSRKTERDEGHASEGNKANTSKKKKKRESSPSMTTINVRKDKLGDKITELQQLVSPFGKSDTASVLHEALGYIRFLHDQVQVLSSPYKKCLPSSAHIQEERLGDDLRSRGLCLVPVSSTENVVSDNGADFWSPAISNYLSLSSKH
ncbi:transcription factor bHLH113-like [Iris pallida]|uniref:Leucine-rich repeat receptor-like protein kinase n=1 Tax=Iris pallida TaxID=29817 RepID=A0AAX6FEX4_IRIPA|nr:putative leucine-rich repeat receptor-like protein kinase [Iris pallida]KAJ6825993.1 transcription factor bHLH113-like [Iris pallida]